MSTRQMKIFTICPLWKFKEEKMCKSQILAFYVFFLPIYMSITSSKVKNIDILDPTSLLLQALHD